MNLALAALLGIGVGLGAAFSGLGGGFLMVPLLIGVGFTPQRAVGTSFLAILVISASALVAHGRLANVDWRVGLLLGLGGIVGAQFGARVLQNVSPAAFSKIFGTILLGLAVWMFVRK
jgi:uncharacterized membrane protein YfcA